MKISTGEIFGWKIDDTIATKLKLLNCCSENRFEVLRCPNMHVWYNKSNIYLFNEFRLLVLSLSIDTCACNIFFLMNFSECNDFYPGKCIVNWSLDIWNNFDRRLTRSLERRLNTISKLYFLTQSFGTKINNTRVFNPRCAISTNCSTQFPNVISLVQNKGLIRESIVQHAKLCTRNDYKDINNISVPGNTGNKIFLLEFDEEE